MSTRSRARRAFLDSRQQSSAGDKSCPCTGTVFRTSTPASAATPDTLYDIASLTKTFASTLLMQCVERGTLILDDPIRRYTSAIPETNATVRHVLSHTSQGTPGAEFRYDGNRYAALTDVVAACHGRPFRQALAWKSSIAWR
jgi:CubicO group peptidase (beta-lactamase class C family)